MGRKILTIQDMHEIAASRGGKCLSTEYKNSQTHLKWACSKGHEWLAVPAEINRGKWCGKCKRRGQSGKYTLEEIQAIAFARGGKCLSGSYKNQSTKLRWQCAHGHEWSAALSNIISQGQWCRHCSTGIGERIARAYFQQIFGRPFPNCRPDWLRVDNGKNLELDGYCSELRIGFEHQGMHHYEASRYGRHTESEATRSHTKTLSYDRIKRERCSERGITLIQIPEIPRLLKLPDVSSFIIDQCVKEGVSVPEKAHVLQVDLREAYSANAQQEALAECRALAAKKGGKCKSEFYINLFTNLEWECSKGHSWFARPSSIKHSNTWCPDCSGLKPLTIEDAHAAAADRGGKCLSQKMINNRQPLTWECAKGHRWETGLGHIKTKNSWCPKCAGVQRLTIEQAHEIAASRNGKCLSKIYLNNRRKLLWECSIGHRWKANLGGVKNSGSWCPKCAGHQKLTLENFKKLAKERGGICISENYSNIKTKLRFRCASNHQWDTSASSVWTQKSWCPVCAQRVPLGIQQMKSLANERGGECLSEEYVNALTPLQWRCAQGHEWRARPNNIKNGGQWCPECAKQKAMMRRKGRAANFKNR